MDFKKRFIEIFKSNIKREGSAELLKYLETTDFFTAPASTRFHGDHEGGLVEHSVLVFERFAKMLTSEYGDKYLKDQKNLESATIIALLHDLCKIGCYKTEMRNVKENGTWVQKPYYAYEDPLPYGHGEKSVYVITGFMKLSREEAFAINWHMGGFDARNGSGNYTIAGAYQQFPLAALFHAADLLTTYLDEKCKPKNQT